MRLTVVDVDGREFRRRFSGYSAVEVEEFRQQVADTLEELSLENADLKRQREELQQRIESYQAMEKSLSDSLLLARQASDEIRATAHAEADVIRKSAEAEAREILRQARQERMDLERSCAVLREEHQRFFEEFRALLQSYLSRAETRLASALARGSADDAPGGRRLGEGHSVSANDGVLASAKTTPAPDPGPKASEGPPHWLLPALSAAEGSIESPTQGSDLARISPDSGNGSPSSENAGVAPDEIAEA